MERRLSWVALALALLGSTQVQAGPLDLKQVSGDAQWMVHIDVDAMRGSSFVEKAYLEGAQQWSAFEAWMSIACDQVGVDPKSDLHGLTLFGTKLGKLEGVALIDAKMQPEQMIGRAKGEAGYQSSTYGKREIHAWTDGQNRVAGAFFTPSLLVVARTDKEVQHALDVLDQKAPSLAGKPNTLGSAPEGTMFQAWVQGLANTPLPLKSPAVKKSQALSLVIGESGGQLFANARLTMESAEAAHKVLAVLEGVRAAAELQYEGDSRIMEVARRVKLSVAEKTVSLDLQAGAEEVWTQLKQLCPKLRG
jgi:hypothetical protein